MIISIVTVAFNSVNTIEATIQSVLSQKHKNVEYIIIDGNSTDGTKDVILKYREHISIYLSEADNGIYDAMNKGIKLATGDIIGILNSDDVFDNNNVLSDVAEVFTRTNDLDFVYGNLVYVANEDINIIKRNWKSTSNYKTFFEDGHVPPHPTLYLKNNVYKKVGLFNLNYKLAADYEFMLRLFKKYDLKSLHIDKTLVRMRLGGATNKNWINILNGNKEIMRSWKENGLQFPISLMPKRIIKRLKQYL